MRRPTLRRPRLPRTRAGRRRLVQAVMAGCVLALLPSTWMYVVTDDRLRTTADAPRTEVAVVFGAGLWEGEPSPTWRTVSTRRPSCIARTVSRSSLSPVTTAARTTTNPTPCART